MKMYIVTISSFVIAFSSKCMDRIPQPVVKDRGVLTKTNPVSFEIVKKETEEKRLLFSVLKNNNANVLEQYDRFAHHLVAASDKFSETQFKMVFNALKYASEQCNEEQMSQISYSLAIATNIMETGREFDADVITAALLSVIPKSDTVLEEIKTQFSIPVESFVKELIGKTQYKKSYGAAIIMLADILHTLKGFANNPAIEKTKIVFYIAQTEGIMNNLPAGNKCLRIEIDKLFKAYKANHK